MINHVLLMTSHSMTTTGPSGPAVQALLNSFTGRRTVPNVFINGKSIGGGDETVALHRNGELGGMLLLANAL